MDRLNTLSEMKLLLSTWEMYNATRNEIMSNPSKFDEGIWDMINNDMREVEKKINGLSSDLVASNVKCDCDGIHEGCSSESCKCKITSLKKEKESVPIEVTRNNFVVRFPKELGIESWMVNRFSFTSCNDLSIEIGEYFKEGFILGEALDNLSPSNLGSSSGRLHIDIEFDVLDENGSVLYTIKFNGCTIDIYNTSTRDIESDEQVIYDIHFSFDSKEYIYVNQEGSNIYKSFKG